MLPIKLMAILEEGSPAAQAAQARAAEEQAERELAFVQDRPMVRSEHLRHRLAKQSGRKRGNCGVVVRGDPDLAAHLAHCCNPVAGDDIVGFITRGRGVSVHRANCPNVRNLMQHPERLIAVEWDTSGATEFQVEIVVEATDRMGLLKDLDHRFGRWGSQIFCLLQPRPPQMGVARMRFLIAISDASVLDPLLASLSRVPSSFLTHGELCLVRVQINQRNESENER